MYHIFLAISSEMVELMCPKMAKRRRSTRNSAFYLFLYTEARLFGVLVDIVERVDLYVLEKHLEV